ncbi:MAG TPA: PIN domain-containing protein [Dehalococcoidia bacterium]|nr:PIN domain-containing protein [Dehalococcoidia bacterium]
MSTVLLDSHVLYWWSAEPQRLSPTAATAVSEASELAVSAITWFELAWLANRDRISVTVPIQAWLEELGSQVRTAGISPTIAATAASLPVSFPGDPMDRLIYATAIVNGWPLVTKDDRLRRHRHGRKIAVW